MKCQEDQNQHHQRAFQSKLGVDQGMEQTLIAHSELCQVDIFIYCPLVSKNNFESPELIVLDAGTVFSATETEAAARRVVTTKEEDIVRLR